MRQAALPPVAIPDWETLFGTFDLCACRGLRFGARAGGLFRRHSALPRRPRRAAAPLFARRPDLGDIELSCENTNTALPLIDLVNEVLENAVAPPPPFAPFTLAAALEADLAQTVATAGA